MQKILLLIKNKGNFIVIDAAHVCFVNANDGKILQQFYYAHEITACSFSSNHRKVKYISN